METLRYLQCLMISFGLSVTHLKGVEQRDSGTGLKRPVIKVEGGGSTGEKAEEVWTLSHPSTHRSPNLLWSAGSPAATQWHISSMSLRKPQPERHKESTRRRQKKATSCPPNSHYSSCASGCPASCSNPTAPDSCRLPCVKGCVCASGFLVSNGTCVSSQQCGCWHEARHYPVGSGFWNDSSCTTKCMCPSPGGTVRCSADSCPKGQNCGVENGTLGCHRQAHGMCRVHGDPHYTTFDQETHHFMGNCTYTLAKLCATGKQLTVLPHFNIEAKNKYLENPSRTFLDKVLVDVHGHRIEIHKDNHRQVMFDHVWRTLPVRNINGSVTVSKSGRYISVEADFQLVVNYDADHSAEIRMPVTFANSTCGMCGNFNGLKEDDSMMPDGQQAHNSTELGNSWKAPSEEDDRTHCGVPDVNPPCTASEEDTYKENEFCGILTNSKGPFKACHSTVQVGSFFDTCVQDMCTFAGKQNLLCNTLAAYGDACQRAGVVLSNWRIETFCLFLCPSNSEHNMCTSACPATCANPFAPKNCSKPCVEGCQCNQGFVFSGGECVSVTECGCMDEDKYYEKGESFWRPGCSSRCRCMENGTLICRPETCKEDQICKVQNGTLGCHVSHTATCHIFGGSHFLTFDERLHHFQGGCNYTAVETYDLSSEQFSVTIRNKRQGDHWTTLHSVSLSFKDLHIVLRKNQVVWVNGARVDLPATLGLGVTVMEKAPYVVIGSLLGLQVEFDGGQQQLFIKVSEKYEGHLRGLCGSYSSNTTKEVAEDSPNKLASSWMVKDPDWKCDPAVPAPLACSPALEPQYKVLCSVLSEIKGPFQGCQEKIHPLRYITGCVYDRCTTAGQSKHCQRSLEAYAAACTRANLHLGDWWAKIPCVFLCPSNSEHNMCTSACPATCANPFAPKNCSKPCVEGCQCNQGFVFSGGECVSVTECGCMDEDKYYEKGESFWRPGCSSRCRCMENGTLICRPETCKEDQICKVQNGTLGCHVSHTATCHIFGGSHFLTFDERLHHFQGGCNYTAVETYDLSSEQFSVTIRNKRQGDHWTTLHSVSLSFKDLHIVLRKNQVVWVNGARVDLPATLGLGVTVMEKAPYVVIGSLLGLQVEFDGGQQQLFIKVSEKYEGHLRGLCGSYSSNTTKEVAEDSPNKLASSWMVKDPDWKCDPAVPAPLACSPALEPQYKVLCSVLSEIKGPFQGCQEKIHPLRYITGCVYDRCTTAGQSKHCQRSLEAYAAACTRANLHLGDWWAKIPCEPTSKCDFTCNFDDNLCQWTQATADDFDWIRHQGSTPSRMTGPSYDHTTGEGHYIYVEGDNGIEGNVAHLLSSPCLLLGRHCFRFWYHLFGAASLMSLRVYVVLEGRQPRRLWIATGSKGDRWLPADVTIAGTGKLQVIVEGMRGEDFASDIAVDDISMSHGSCGDAAVK